jgi:uncharacterized membrane protein YbhN (UPF0104 family)
MVASTSGRAAPKSAKSSRAKTIFVVIFLLLIAALVVLFRKNIHFDWRTFVAQLHSIAWSHIAAGTGLIYATYWLRATRWSVFVRPTRPVSPRVLLGPQFIGFTAVALFGRLADLTRPYLVTQRTGLPLASQIAVYTIERMFDLGAAAILFSGALAFTPSNLPHHDLFVHVGLASLAGTATLAIVAVAIRLAGERVAKLVRATLGRLSASLGESVATKLLGFRDGLNAIGSFRDFIVVLALSLGMWTMIAYAYVQTAHAFVGTPELANVTFSRIMLLMAASIGSSVLQFPIIGWFTQIGALATTMHEFFGAPVEAATACGALLLFVTQLSIIPAGLIFARLEGVSLRQVSEQSAEGEAAIIDGDPLPRA